MRILSHYFVVVGQTLNIFLEASDLKALVGAPATLWLKIPKWHWFPAGDPMVACCRRNDARRWFGGTALI